MISIQIPSFVEKELLEATTYYDTQSSGLGDDFAREVQRLLDRLSIFPTSAPRLGEAFRLCPLQRFPYSLLYEVESELLVIVGLIHQKQGPETCEEKLKRASSAYVRKASP